MNQSAQEQLSALIDGELTESERRRLLSQVLSDVEHRATLARYSLLGDVLRGQGAPVPSMAFTRSVSAALAHEPTVLAPRRYRAPTWLKPVSGVALAASVAAAALYFAPGLMQTGIENDPVPHLAQTGIENDPVPQLAQIKARSGPDQVSIVPPQQGLMTVAAPVPVQSVPPEMARRLNRYLVNHGEYASGNGMNRVLPYAAFVSYDLGR